MLPKLRQLEEEDPELRIVWNEQLREIQAKIMGEVQTEILQSIIKERFSIDVSFDSGSIIYKETIANTVEGVGTSNRSATMQKCTCSWSRERGSGLQFAADCSDDVLAGSWKNLIMTHLREKEHKGVLTGSPVTDMKITLVSGRAHVKHTAGGDFRGGDLQGGTAGTYGSGSRYCWSRTIPSRLELPEKLAGHALADIDRMRGTCTISRIEDGTAYIEGEAPVATMKNYQKELTAYTRGQGKIFCSLKGYEPCHNTEEVIRTIGYDPEKRCGESIRISVLCQWLGIPCQLGQSKGLYACGELFQKGGRRGGNSRGAKHCKYRKNG